MKKTALLAAFLSACATGPKAIRQDGLEMRPPAQDVPSVPVKKVSSTFVAMLKELAAPKVSRMMLAGSCPAPVSQIEHSGTTFRFASPTICVKSILGEPICKVGFTLTQVTPDVDTSMGVTRNEIGRAHV